MASNKNNRKKGKKRAPQRTAPEGFVGKKDQYAKETKESKKEPFFVKYMTMLKLAGLILMLGGYILAYTTPLHFGFLIGCAGALLSSFLVGFDAKQNTKGMQLVSRICYAVFAALMLYLWLQPVK